MRFRGGKGGRSGFSLQQAVAGGKRRKPEAGAQGGGIVTMSATVQVMPTMPALPSCLLQTFTDTDRSFSEALQLFCDGGQQT